MKILVTGFEPFGGETINPAWEAVKRLPDSLAEATVIKLEIPTTFYQSAEVVSIAIKKYQPDVVINVGQAGGRADITPERIAINLDDARIADNMGQQPIDQPIQLKGEAAYFSQLPVKAIVTRLQQASLPASVSNTAGTFVCNHIMYQVQYLIAKSYPMMTAGFIHVPYSHEQVKEQPEKPSLSLEEITKGLYLAIEQVIAYYGRPDIGAIGGAEH